MSENGRNSGLTIFFSMTGLRERCRRTKLFSIHATSILTDPEAVLSEVHPTSVQMFLIAANGLFDLAV